MNTFQLWDAMVHDEPTKKYHKFLGVYARDTLPKRLTHAYPYGLISNTSRDADRDGGTHWVAIWINSASEAEFFDSFGKTSLTYGVEFDTFIKRAAPQSEGRYKENLTQVQHPSSDYCGLFCLFYVYHKVRGLTMARIVFMFSYPRNLKSNDALLSKFARHKLHFCNNAKKCMDIDADEQHSLKSLKMYKVMYT